MARYKAIDTSPRFLAVDLEKQLLPGSFEFAVNHHLESEFDLSIFDACYCNDQSGASDYPPGMLLKVILYAYAQFIDSRRASRPLRKFARNKPSTAEYRTLPPHPPKPMSTFPVQLFTGSIRPLPESGRPTGVYKTRSTGELQFTCEGIAGEQQADQRVHGGAAGIATQWQRKIQQRLDYLSQ